MLVEAAGGSNSLKSMVLQLGISARLTSEALPTGNDDHSESSISTDFPFELPGDWRWACLADIVEFINGDRSKNYPSKLHQVDSGIPFINAGHLNNGAIDCREMNYITEERFNLLRGGKVREGDILYCLRGSLGKAAIVSGLKRGAIASSLVILRSQLQKCIPAYLMRCLASPLGLRLIRKYDNGTAQPNLSATDVKKFVVPLPPLAEQKRIVARVDQLMALIDDLEQKQIRKRQLGANFTKASLEALTGAESPEEFDSAWRRVVENWGVAVDRVEAVSEVRGTVFDLAIRARLTATGGTGNAGQSLLEIEKDRNRLIDKGVIRRQNALPRPDAEPFALPPTWAWAQLGDLCFKVTDGPHFSPKYVDAAEGVPFLSARNVRPGGFDLTDLKHVSKEDHATFCERTRPERGDIIYTKGGTTGVAVVNTLGFEFSVWVHLAVLKIAQTHVLPDYLALALNSPHCYAQSQKHTHGTGNRDLGLTRMVLITVPLPPLAEQKRIVAKVDHLMKLCDELETKLRRAEDRASRLVEAVVGEMVG